MSSNNTERVQGLINKLTSEKRSGRKSGVITVCDSDEEFYFLADRLRNADYDSLKKGDRVSFSIGGANRTGRRFANDIDAETGDTKHEVKDITSTKPENQPNQSVADELIENLLGAFRTADICRRSDGFEDATFILLRCLGVHRLYQYDRKAQAGKADGFFIVGNLAVMYDCTLRDDFMEYKKDQIENYVHKVSQYQLTIPIKNSDGGSGSKVLDIKGKTKHVWVITRNRTRELNDYDDVKVKEVSIQDLLKVLATRLYSGTFEEEALSGMLARIDKT